MRGMDGRQNVAPRGLSVGREEQTPRGRYAHTLPENICGHLGALK